MIGELKIYHCSRCGSDVFYRLWKWKGFVFCGGCVAELNGKTKHKPGLTARSMTKKATQPWYIRLWNWIKKIMRASK